MVTGAAPIESKVKAFIRETLSAYVVEGYGQTENFGGISGTFFSNYHVDDGTVGTVFPCGTIKLVDVDDTNYLAKNNQGEICYRGHNLMKVGFCTTLYMNQKLLRDTLKMKQKRKKQSTTMAGFTRVILVSFFQL